MEIRPFLEILVCGYAKDKVKINTMLEKIQKELDKINRLDISAAFYLSDDENKTWEEMENFHTGRLIADFYVFSPRNYKIKNGYVANLIKTIESGITDVELKNLGINRNFTTLRIVK